MKKIITIGAIVLGLWAVPTMAEYHHHHHHGEWGGHHHHWRGEWREGIWFPFILDREFEDPGLCERECAREHPLSSHRYHVCVRYCLEEE